MSGFVRVCWKNTLGVPGDTTDYPDVSDGGLRHNNQSGVYIIEFIDSYRRMFIDGDLVAWACHMEEA